MNAITDRTPIPPHSRTGNLLADCQKCGRSKGRSLCDYCGFFLNDRMPKA